MSRPWRGHSVPSYTVFTPMRMKHLSPVFPLRLFPLCGVAGMVSNIILPICPSTPHFPHLFYQSLSSWFSVFLSVSFLVDLTFHPYGTPCLALLETLFLYLLSDPVSKLTFFARCLSLCCSILVVIVLL